MSDLEIESVGYYILVELIEVESVTEGGIVLANSQVNREQNAASQGIIRGIGPLAFCGFPGVVDNNVPVGMTRGEYFAKQWGIKVGDTVEFRA